VPVAVPLGRAHIQPITTVMTAPSIAPREREAGPQHHVALQARLLLHPVDDMANANALGARRLDAVRIF
jgi:hypothetical protein